MSGDFSFLKGNINTIILCALYDKDGKSGDKYGYEIAKEIKDRTENKYEIKQPTLYSYLKKLEEQDLITSYWGIESNGGRRRYYSLTQKGRHDCEQFMAEWEYHKNVLNTLVTTSETPVTVTQDQVTPLFGEKSKKKKTDSVHSQKLEEQDEISRRLDELLQANKDTTVTETTDTEDVAEQEFEPPIEAIEESTATKEVVEEQVATDVVNDTTENVASETTQEAANEETDKFEINQDNADEFMQNFEERVRVATESIGNQPDQNENYQHILLKVIGDQLDDMQEMKAEQNDVSQKYYTDHPVALEDVADNLARQGIHMRIYNHASAHFKSKTLIPIADVLCKTSWVTYAFAAIYFGILMLASVFVDNWKPFLITLAVLLIVPIALTIYALYDTSRREKPEFVFKNAIIVTGILAVVVALLSLGISILTKIELGDFAAVGNQILLPTGIALLLPTFTAVFNYFFKKY